MRTFLLAIVLLFPGFAAAERLPLKAYTVADGLPNNVINKIVRDSRGFLWFCTSEGLSRFDGYTFTNYGVDQGLPQRSRNCLRATVGFELAHHVAHVRLHGFGADPELGSHAVVSGA